VGVKDCAHCNIYLLENIVGIETSELPRLYYTAHEVFILRYAQLSKPLPADPSTVDALVDDHLITRTDDPQLYALTPLGQLACSVLKRQINELVAEQGRGLS
jgi:hypothetical protein